MHLVIAQVSLVVRNFQGADVVWSEFYSAFFKMSSALNTSKRIRSKSTSSISVEFRWYSLSSYLDRPESRWSSVRRLEHAVPRKCDNNGFLMCNKGDILKERYAVLRYLAEGNFARVFEAQDLQSNRKVALKISKKLAGNWYTRREIDVLTNVRNENTMRAKFLVHMLDHFSHNDHHCVAFELLGKSVSQFQAENGFHPFPMNQVRKISFQLISAVGFLHDRQLAHTDIKPDNIMFVNANYTTYEDSSGKSIRRINNSDIRLIDFGLVGRADKLQFALVTADFYRAPEVILELGWTQPCDIWSIGCIMFELVKGQLMFAQHDDLEHLIVMECFLGPIPKQMAIDSPNKFYFYENHDLRWDKSTARSVALQLKHLPLSYWVTIDKTDETQFYTLLIKMLQYEPSQRITSRAAFRDPFFEF